MQSRTNIIMSHGGRHGAGGTYLRGAKIDPKTSESVPNRLLTGDSREAWAGAPAPAVAAPRKVTNEDAAAFSKGSPEAKALVEAVEKDRAAEAAATGKPPPKPVGMTTTPPPPGFPTPGAEKPSLPTSRRQLTVMRKGELKALATAYEVDSDGTADAIRDRLKVHFFDHEAGDTEE